MSDMPVLTHYKLIVQYDGTNYLGWQVQPQGPTIQGTLEAAAEQLFGTHLRVSAAGRTDTGVHALGQVACFQAPKALPTEVVQRALNALTPPDIGIADVAVVAADFDPRRDAHSRTYCYRLWTPRWRSPFWHRYAWHVWAPLDLDAMRSAAALLLGEHDFASFQAADCDAEHAIRRVLRSELQVHDEQLIYTVEATAFVRHMVRNVIGTLVEVGRGERTAADFVALLDLRDRSRAGMTAPAHGLCLMQVQYQS